MLYQKYIHSLIPFSRFIIEEEDCNDFFYHNYARSQNGLKNVKREELFLYLIHVQSVPINTKVVSSNPFHGEVYSIQHCVIKFVSDLRQVSGFLWVVRFPPPIELTATI